MSSMNDLIPLINKLQDILSEVGNSPIDLPQIAVVGSQSSGKSSVLEAIVGKDFLPKGSGIVTRRPLVLQLQYSAVGPSGAPQDWAEFLHNPGHQYADFEEVKSEIEAETHRIAGANKGISSEPIHLKVFSPNVVDLTLVDLPGLTKIPVGDQPSDIELQIRELIMGYIMRPNCIILAVSPANVDLANSDSLKLAREVDPAGARTLGLLTKLDLMDAGTSALEILSGRVYPLRLGFVGVVNRSQRDIEMRRSLEYARKREAQYFSAHPVYSSITAKCGTLNLARTLNAVLLAHIRERLPELKVKLNALIGAKQAELATYGDAPSPDAAAAGQSPHSLVLRLITKYASDFNSSVEGTNPGSATTELSGGARLFHIFDQVFGHSLESMDPVASLSVREIRTAMRNATGSRPALFIPEAAFDLLVKPQIARLEAPALRCVDTVYEELLRLTHESCFPELRRYPVLRARVLDGVSDLLKEHLAPTRAFVQTLVAIQRAYINTSHPDFIGGAAAVAQLEKKYERERRKKESADRMRRLTHQYSANAAIGSAGGAAGSPLGGPGAAGVSPSFDHHLASMGGAGRPSANLFSQMSLNRGPASALGIGSANAAAAAAAAAASSGGNAPHREREGFLTYLFGSQQRPPSIYGPGPSAGGFGNASSTSLAAPPPPPMSHSAVSPTMSAVNGIGSNPSPLALDEDGEPAMPATPSAVSQAPAPQANGNVSYDTPGGATRDREDFAIALIRSLISSYFGIVKKALADAVPKAVMHLLVNQTKEALQNRLVQALYRDALFDELLQEDAEVTRARNECKDMLDTYTKALEVIAQAF
ncbi:Dynamin- GTPase protein [Blastocladiella emersonii ATCC 22665]|nr:Dynamin- GTPase protein [Blastocladiella emersonii ATCC 22665]